MKHHPVAALALCACFPLVLSAQPPSDRGSSDRGGDRGSDRGGDRGSRFGGFGGGPPGGGFGGSPSGGPPGGGSGGPPGGGFFGGERPDPSEFLKRLDRNGNNAIDPDEMEGPARFMIERMARDNPNIRTDRPVPLDTIRQSFDRMRSGGSSDSRDGRDSRDSNRDSSRDSGRDSGRDGRPAAPAAPQPLVPDFKIDKPALSPVLGFGMAGELFDVDLLESDFADARERIQQYDKNKDGMLAKDEIDGRWSGNPMDYDRNQDGRLSLNELAVRYARRRIERQGESQSDRKTARRDDRRTPAPDPNAPPPLRSLKLPEPAKPSGVPDWFTDQNGDGQLDMAEYKSNEPWTDEKFAAFNHYDLNGDGLIIPSEARSNGRQSASTMAFVSSRPPEVSPEIANRNLSFAKKIVERGDKNKNGKLDPDELQGGVMDVRAMDTDGDGCITIEEYAGHLNRKNAAASR